MNLDLVQSGKRVTTEDMMAVCVTQADFEHALDEVDQRLAQSRMR